MKRNCLYTQHWLPEAFAKWKKANIKGYILFIWHSGKQNHRDRNQVSGCQELEVGEGNWLSRDSEELFGGDGNVPYLDYGGDYTSV